MASVTGKSIEIHAVRTVSGNQPLVRRIIEKLTMTFLSGTPVEIDTALGAIMAWDGTTVAAKIAGFSNEGASSLTTTGVAKTLTFGSVPNQSAAVNIPRGAPLNDGKVGFEVSVSDSVFHGQFGYLSGTLASQEVGAATDVGKYFGLTVDTDGHWFVDRTKVNAGVDTVVVVVKLDENDPRGCYFVVAPAAQQVVA